MSVNLSFTKAQQDKAKVIPLHSPCDVWLTRRSCPPLMFEELTDMLVLDKKVMSSEKMVYDFTPKVKYDIYAPALKFLLQNDLVTVDKVIDYLPCKAEYAMTPFIVAMTERRIEAQKMINDGKTLLVEHANDSEGEVARAMTKKGETLKDFYKLINNSSSYGKTIQDDTKFRPDRSIDSRAVDNVKYLNNYVTNNCKVVCPPTSEEGDEGMAQYSASKPRVTIKAPMHMGSGDPVEQQDGHAGLPVQLLLPAAWLPRDPDLLHGHGLGPHQAELRARAQGAGRRDQEEVLSIRRGSRSYVTQRIYEGTRKVRKLSGRS